MIPEHVLIISRRRRLSTQEWVSSARTSQQGRELRTQAAAPPRSGEVGVGACGEGRGVLEVELEKL